MRDGVVYLQDVRAAARALGLSERSLCVHSSLRSFGLVKGGAETVLRGLLAEGCTVMAPTFTYENEVPPPLDQRPPRNGTSYNLSERASERVYDPDSLEVSDDMGAIPKALVATPGRVRGDHPLDSFSAVGPSAHALVGDQTSLDVYAPFRSLSELGGSVVLMGVGLTRMTLLHFAETLAGRNLFIRWVNDKKGLPVGVKVGGCSEGFEKLAPELADLERRRMVGKSLWRVFPAGETLERAARAIRRDPAITRCGEGSCERCRDALRGGPVLTREQLEGMVATWR